MQYLMKQRFFLNMFNKKLYGLKGDNLIYSVEWISVCQTPIFFDLLSFFSWKKNKKIEERVLCSFIEEGREGDRGSGGKGQREEGTELERIHK